MFVTAVLGASMFGVLAQGARPEPALTGNWDCTYQGDLSIWSFGPGDLCRIQTKNSPPHIEFIMRQDGTYTLKNGTLTVHPKFCWHQIQTKRTIDKPMPWQQKLTWIDARTFSVHGVFRFKKREGPNRL